MVATTLLALAGTAAVYLRLRGEFPRAVNLTTLALLAGATPIAWYALFEPALLDLTIFALTAGCAAATRVGVEARGPMRWTRSAAWLAMAVLPLAFGLLRAVNGGLTPGESRWADVLFSSWHGFLSLTPVAYFAVVGTCLYLRRNPAYSAAALAILVTSAWVAGASRLWLAEPAFGSRSLLSVLVWLAPGLACLIDDLRRRPALALIPLVVMAIGWNHLLMAQYTVGMLPKDEPVSFARLVRQQADLQTRTMPVYPFAFPANVWFGIREGVPASRYELLAMEPRQSAVALVLDRTAERFLLDGWTGPTAEGEIAGWWIGEREASVVVPLARGPSNLARVTIVARTRFEEPTVEADLGIRLNGSDIGTFSPAATQASEVHFTVPASLLRDGYNRITIVSRGTHRVDASDMRPPGPLARRAGRSPWPVAVYKVAIDPL